MDVETERIERIERMIADLRLAIGELSADRARLERLRSQVRVSGFGKRLRQRRHAAGYTLRDLGKLAGLSYQSIQAYECQRATPRPAALRRVAAVLGVTVDELLREDEHAAM